MTSIGAYPAGPAAARVAMVAGAVSNSTPGRTTIVAVSIDGFSTDSIDGVSMGDGDVSLGGVVIAAVFAIFAVFAAGFFAGGAFATGAAFAARGFAAGDFTACGVGVAIFGAAAGFDAFGFAAADFTTTGFAAGGGTGTFTAFDVVGTAASAASAFFSGALETTGAGVVRRTSRGFKGSAVGGVADAGGADDESGERLSGCFALAMDLVPEVRFAG